MEYFLCMISLLIDLILISMANFYDMLVNIVMGIILTSINYCYVNFNSNAALCRLLIEYGYSANFYVQYFWPLTTNYILIQLYLVGEKLRNSKKFNISQYDVRCLSISSRFIYFIFAYFSYFSLHVDNVTNMPSLFLNA